jgi:ferredoxin
MKNLNKACKACGICAAVCPASAITIVESDTLSADTASVADGKITGNAALSADANDTKTVLKPDAKNLLKPDTKNADVSAIKNKVMNGDKNDSKKEVAVFACENSGAPAFRALRGMRHVAVLEMCCGGETAVNKLIDAARTHKRVIAAVCQLSACRHYDGSKRAGVNVAEANRRLAAAGLAVKVELLYLSHALPELLAETVGKK